MLTMQIIDRSPEMEKKEWPDQTRPGLALVESLKASLGKEEVW